MMEAMVGGNTDGREGEGGVASILLF